MRTRSFVLVSLILIVLSGCAFAQMRWVTSQPVVNMFSQPSADSDVVSQTIYGFTVTQIPADAKTKVPDGWMHIKTPDDYTGWVQRIAYLPLDEKETFAGKEKRVVTVANRAANVYREIDLTKHAPVLTLPFESPLEFV